MLAASPVESYRSTVSDRIAETLPPGYDAAHVGDSLVVARADLLPAAARALAAHGSLHAWAAARPGTKPLAGRGVTWAADAPEGVPIESGRAGSQAPRWVVRHYRRGGAVARWLGDRYLGAGEPRPLRELRISVAARARRVPTPEVLALALYPAGAFYRADLATAEIPQAMDLAESLWAEHAGADDPSARMAALAAAGALLRELAAAGVRHPDLNAKNILLATADSGSMDGLPATPAAAEGLVAWVLDLDGARVGPPLSWRRRREAEARLERSLRKWERRTGRHLAPAEWAGLRAAIEADAPSRPEAAHA